MGPRSKRPRREEVSGGGASRATQKEQGNAACCKASWMEKSHDRDGDKALLSYNFSRGPERENPLDPGSKDTGDTRDVLSEIYESLRESRITGARLKSPGATSTPWCRSSEAASRAPCTAVPSLSRFGRALTTLTTNAWVTDLADCPEVPRPPRLTNGVEFVWRAVAVLMMGCVRTGRSALTRASINRRPFDAEGDCGGVDLVSIQGRRRPPPHRNGIPPSTAGE